jgi:hypothetical protein
MAARVLIDGLVYECLFAQNVGEYTSGTLTAEEIARLPLNQAEFLSDRYETICMLKIPLTFLSSRLHSVMRISMEYSESNSLLHLAMGFHPRLGQHCLLRQLQPEILKNILDIWREL